jgi:hypothetical protein
VLAMVLWGWLAGWWAARSRQNLLVHESDLSGLLMVNKSYRVKGHKVVPGVSLTA